MEETLKGRIFVGGTSEDRHMTPGNMKAFAAFTAMALELLAEGELDVDVVDKVWDELINGEEEFLFEYTVGIVEEGDSTTRSLIMPDNTSTEDFIRAVAAALYVYTTELERRAKEELLRDGLVNGTGEAPKGLMS